MGDELINLGFDGVETLTYTECFERLGKALLQAQVSHVMGASPFYREKYAQSGIDNARPFDPGMLTALPFTSKAEILEEQRLHPPFGRLAVSDRACLRRVHLTSGSTGRPVYIMMTENDVRYTTEAGARAFRCAGLTPDDMIIHCLNYCMWAGGVTDHLCLEATGATVIPFGVGNSHNLIDTIRTMRPTAISCTPSYLSRLELLLQQEFRMRPEELGLKKAFLGGEGGLQNPDVRDRIEKTWNIKAVDANYGMSDVLSIFGSECDHRQGLHFHGQGILHLELVDPIEGRPLPVIEGQEGEMVLTTLRREAQPLIRYRTGDVIRIISTDKCRCGRSSFRFVVSGRADDMITVRGVNVYPGALGALIADRSDLFSGEFEIVLDTPPPFEMPVVRVELAQGVSGNLVADAEGYLLTECRRRLSFTPALSFLAFGEFPRTEGKTRRIKKAYLSET